MNYEVKRFLEGSLNSLTPQKINLTSLNCIAHIKKGVNLISWRVMVIWELIIGKTVRNTVRGEYFSSLTFGDSSIVWIGAFFIDPYQKPL